MAQINFHTTPEFERQLSVLMRLKAIPTKSEAIRIAVAAQAKAAQATLLRTDFSALIGLVAQSQNARFISDDELWEKDADAARVGQSHGG